MFFYLDTQLIISISGFRYPYGSILNPGGQTTKSFNKNWHKICLLKL